MLPIIEFGPLTLRTPGLALLAGVWFGLEIAARFGRKRGIRDDTIYNIGFWSLVGAVVAARLAYVLIHLPVYLGITPIPRALLAVITPVPGNENAVVGVVVGAAIFTGMAKRQSIDILALLDSYAPAIALMVVGIGLSNLFGGDLYGIETNLPWAIDLWGAQRHPTQIYLLLVGLFVFSALILHEVRASQSRSTGVLFQVTLIAIGITLLLIEPLRADSPVIFNGVRLWQVIGLGCALIALAGFIWRSPSAQLQHES